MMVTGMIPGLNGTRPAGADTGLRVILHFKNDTLIYDAQIPFYALNRPLTGHASFSIGIIEKGLLPPGFNDGGMPSEGGGPPGGEEMQKAFRDDNIWFKITLSSLLR